MENPGWRAKWISDEGYLGIHLIVGFLIALICGAAFGMIADHIFATPQVISADAHAQSFVQQIKSPQLTSIERSITFFGSPGFLWTASIIIAAILSFVGSRRRLYTFASIMGGGGLLMSILKDIFKRTRPTEFIPLITEHGYSFPSGHSMGSMLFFGGLAYVLFFTVPRRWLWRTLAILFCLTLVLLIGSSRIYLGVHYFSDVIAGFVAGLGWIGICVSGTEAWVRFRTRQGKKE